MMKKLIALLCAAALAFTVVGCSSASSDSTGSDSSSSESASTSESTPETDVDPEEPATPPEGGDTTDGDSGTSTEPVEADADLSALIDSIYASVDPGIMVATSGVDLSQASWVTYYTGLEDASNLDAAVASEAMIGSQAYSLVLVRVKDGVDATEIANQMAAGIDPAKWICAQADDLQVGAAGNIAMLIMVDTALSETVTAAQIADAFVTASGDDTASCWVPETIGAAGHSMQ